MLTGLTWESTAEAVIQAGAIHGGVHLRTVRRSFPPPRQLPADAAIFVDRERDLFKLDGLLAAPDTGPTRVSTVAGSPGVGKTALAVHWAHRVRERFPDGDLYIDMQGYGPEREISPDQALGAFLRALDVPPETIPDTIAERAALYRSLLDDKGVLVILDNVRSPAQVRPLIPASPRCFTLVTGRSVLSGLVTIQGAARVTLEVLSPDEAARLLATLLGNARIGTDERSARRLAELCGYLPLSLRVVAELALRRTRLSLADLVTELEGEQQRLDFLASTDDELSDTRGVFSWSYRALDPGLMRAFRLFSLHTGREVGTAAAAALFGTDAATARRRLRALADVHLLEETAADRFRMHDLLRAYSAECCLAEETQHERILAARRLLTWYLLASDMARQVSQPHFVDIPLVPAGDIGLLGTFVDRPAVMRWFALERSNILAAVRQAAELGQFDITWKLAVTASGLFELASYWSEWEEIHRIGLSAARTLGDRLGEAANLLLLGDAAWRLGHAEEATANYEQAARLGHALSVAWIEGFALRGTGLMREEAGAFTNAAEAHETALAVFRAGGLRRGEGMCLLSLGTCARALGDGDRAVELGALAVTIFEEIADTWTVAWGRLALAASLAAVDRVPEAVAHLRQAQQTFNDLGDRLTEAQTLAALGDLAARTGETEDARDCWSQAADLYEAGGDDAAATELRARAAGPGTDGDAAAGGGGSPLERH